MDSSTPTSFLKKFFANTGVNMTNLKTGKKQTLNMFLTKNTNSKSRSPTKLLTRMS